MLVTLNIPEDLATRLTPFQENVSQILELGLREFRAVSITELNGASELLEFLADLPTPEDILALQAPYNLQSQVKQLLENNRDKGLTQAEERLWEQYQYLEHLVRMAKIKAHLKLHHE